MHIFIDDSGSFSWHNPGISLFVSVLTPDREIPDLVARFAKWKRTVIGKSNRELKGEELTDNQLYSFTYQVLPHRLHNPLLTVVGFDTRITAEAIIRRCRDQVSEQFGYSSKLVLQHNPSNTGLAQSYTEMSGWARNRSTQNFAWVNTLEEEILQSVQHLTVYFYDEEYDAEFENIEILIDRSFINRERHIIFWKEWLRNGLVGRNHRGEAFIIPDEWAKRNHPFVRKYDDNGICEFNDLYHKHMRFEDSRREIGLQIADTCANICYRYYRGNRHLTAYRQLRPRIVGEGGRPMTVIRFTEGSLYKDGVENHVRTLDIAAIREIGRKRKEQRDKQRAAAKAGKT